MYFLALSGMHGYDTIVWSTISGYRAGDLLLDGTIAFLCIGKDIEFSELYKKQRAKEHNFIEPVKFYKQLLSKKTLEIIHRMVKQYFSSYKHVISLYIPSGLENRLPKKAIKPEESPQTCIIFPDIRSLTQTFPIETLSPNTAILHGGMTQVQKAKIFRSIKLGITKTLLTTNRGLFFDRANLSQIIVYSSSNWAYSGQSEPRFVIKEVAEKVGEVYTAKIELRS